MNREFKALAIWAAGAGTTAIAIAISGQSMVSAIAGDEALRHHRYQYLGVLSERTGLLEQQVQTTEVQRGAVDQVEARLRSLIDCEITDGCVSGRGGSPGPTSRALSGFLPSMQEVQDDATASVSTLQGHLAASRGYIEAARRAARDDDEEGFSESVSAAQSEISQAQGRVGDALFAGNPLAGSGFREVDSLARQLADLQALSLVEGFTKPLPNYVEIERQEAIRLNSDRIGLAWVWAVSLEAIPLLCLSIVILAAFLRRPNDNDFDDLDFEFPYEGEPVRTTKATKVLAE